MWCITASIFGMFHMCIFLELTVGHKYEGESRNQAFGEEERFPTGDETV